MNNFPPGFVRVRYGYVDPPEDHGNLTAVDWPAGAELPRTGDSVILPGSTEATVRSYDVRGLSYIFLEGSNPYGGLQLHGIEIDATS